MRGRGWRERVYYSLQYITLHHITYHCIPRYLAPTRMGASVWRALGSPLVARAAAVSSDGIQSTAWKSARFAGER